MMANLGNWGFDKALKGELKIQVAFREKEG